MAVLAVVAVVLGSCGGGAETRPATGSRPPRRTTTTTAAPPVAPLTGLADPQGRAARRPVLSVKVENTPEARPQRGLADADVIWTEVVEGGITRFLAMYHSTVPDVVGPVRSVRLTDPPIVWPVGGILAFSGGARYALDALRRAPVVAVDEAAAGRAMYRDRTRRPPHNLFARPALLWERPGRPVPPPALFGYDDAAGAGGEPAAEVTVGYPGAYRVSYRWDPAARGWARFEGGRPFVDPSGATLAPTNVVVLVVTYRGGVGRLGAEAQLMGEGDAWVLVDGRVVRGRWSRPRVEAPARLVAGDGAEIRLRPGRTWVELADPSHTLGLVPQVSGPDGR